MYTTFESWLEIFKHPLGRPLSLLVVGAMPTWVATAPADKLLPPAVSAFTFGVGPAELLVFLIGTAVPLSIAASTRIKPWVSCAWIAAGLIISMAFVAQVGIVGGVQIIKAVIAVSGPIGGVFLGSWLWKRAQPVYRPTCRRCGYSLEGLPRDGICPECGTESR